MISTMWGVLWPTVGLVDEATGWRAPTGLCLLPTFKRCHCAFPHFYPVARPIHSSPFPHYFLPSLFLTDKLSFKKSLPSSLPLFPRITTIIVRLRKI